MLTIIIHTKNSSQTLPAALKSAMFADELLVVDMHSDDDSVKIAKKFSARILTVPDIGFVEPARNFAIESAKGDWIFILDADEEIPEKLKESITAATKGEDAIYRIPRKNMIWGHWMQHTGWWPDFQIRLFKKGLVSWTEEIHGQPIMKQDELFFPLTSDIAIIHYNYPSVESYIDRLNRYTSITAAQADLNTSKIKTSAEFYSIFSEESIYRLFAGEGIKDGPYGVSLSLLQGMYKLATELKIWERQGFKAKKENEAEIIQEIKKWRNELNYRIMDWEIRKKGGIRLVMWNAMHRIKHTLIK